MTDKTGIQEALDKFDGSPSRLAAACGNGVKRQHVEHWRRSGRVPPGVTPIVSAATGVPCNRLNDGVRWDLVRIETALQGSVSDVAPARHPEISAASGERHA